VRQAMTLKRLKKLQQYLHLNNEEGRPDQQSADYDILYKARPALDLMDKFTQAYIPRCKLDVDESMIHASQAYRQEQKFAHRNCIP
jgi:hypothetical protein